ncbi:MAG: hypothetical protein MZU95_02840 [Desulfomicrobium escambiense]|nr:hypothetical protein [Desulfomicrobium escambiense]
MPSRRADSAHAARVGTCVTLSYALVVAARRHHDRPRFPLQTAITLTSGPLSLSSMTNPAGRR